MHVINRTAYFTIYILLKTNVLDWMFNVYRIYQKQTNFSCFFSFYGFQFDVRWCHIQWNRTHSHWILGTSFPANIIFEWKKESEKKKSTCTSNWNLLLLFHPRHIRPEFLISTDFLCRCCFCPGLYVCVCSPFEIAKNFRKWDLKWCINCCTELPLLSTATQIKPKMVMKISLKWWI